jgi:ABC-type glycerol-3-phosphate transport system permease component
MTWSEIRAPERILTALSWLAVTALGLFIVLPFVLGLVAAMLTPSDLMSRTPTFWPLHPENFWRAWTEARLARYFWNSIVIASISTTGTMVTSILAAYAFARMEFAGKTVLFWLVLGALAIPDLIGIIPNYLLMAKFQLVPSLWAAILPALASGFTTFFLRQHFMGVPVMYDEAARIDGAGPFKILVDIVIPIAWPAIASMALFAFIAQWNSYLWPLIVLRGDTQTVQIALANLQSDARDDAFTDWPLILSASCIVLVPSFLFFIFAERQLVRGAGLGGSK